MKKILIFSNREQIGDGIIKLPFIYEVKLRFPDYAFFWATNSGKTVYNGSLKSIASNYIDFIYEQVPLISYFLKIKSQRYDLNQKFDIIIDTQKTFIRSLALKSLKSNKFISSSANWILSDIKPKVKTNIKNQYYLNNLFFMLDLVSIPKKDKSNFDIQFPINLIREIDNIFDKNKKYFGFAPGSATKIRIWNLENFLYIANYFEKLNYIPTFFLGPLEKKLKEIIINKVPNAFFPEDLISNFSGPEVVMAASKHLICSLTNDSGTSHMLSVGSRSLIKIIGPTTSKFTSKNDRFFLLDSKEYGGEDVNLIKPSDVIFFIEKNNLLS